MNPGDAARTVPTVNEHVISEAVALLCRHAKPVRIILFGSHARGAVRPDSDVDLLVVLAEVSDRAAEMVRLARLLSPLRLPVEVLVTSEETFRYWRDTPGNIYHAAQIEGRVLYEPAA